MNKRYIQFLFNDFVLPNDDKILFFSSANFLLEFDFKKNTIQFSKSINTDICKMIAHNTSIERLFLISDKLIVINYWGDKVYVYNVSDNSWEEIKIGCHQKEWGNYLNIILYKGCIYLIPRYRNYILKMDIQKMVIHKIQHSFLSDMNKENVFVSKKAECIYFFEQQSNRVFVYDMEKDEFFVLEIEGTLGNIISVQYCNEKFLILSPEGKLMEWDEHGNRLKIIIDVIAEKEVGDFFEFAITDKNIWLLPRYGDDIYIYDFDDERLRKYDCYPQDYEYIGYTNWNKFGKCHEYNNKMYFGMRSANHLLIIDKKTGNENWIRPVFPSDEESCIFRINHNLPVPKDENIISLGTYIHCLGNLGSGIKAEAKNIGGTIWEFLRETV